MAKIDLLPRKAFVITLDNGTVINGRFSLWSVHRYCELKKLSLAGLEAQMSAENISFDDICKLILCAVEEPFRKRGEGMPYKDMDVCEWIEDLGGLTGENYQALMAHAQSDLPATDEKKSEPATN